MLKYGLLLTLILMGCSHVHHFPVKHYEDNCLIAFYYDEQGELKGMEQKCMGLVPHSPADEEKPQ